MATIAVPVAHSYMLHHGDVLHHGHMVHDWLHHTVHDGTHHSVHGPRHEATLLEATLLMWLWGSANGGEHRCECHHEDQRQAHLRENHVHSRHMFYKNYLLIWLQQLFEGDRCQQPALCNKENKSDMNFCMTT